MNKNIKAKRYVLYPLSPIFIGGDPTENTLLPLSYYKYNKEYLIIDYDALVKALIRKCATPDNVKRLVSEINKLLKENMDNNRLTLHADKLMEHLKKRFSGMFDDIVLEDFVVWNATSYIDSKEKYSNLNIPVHHPVSKTLYIPGSSIKGAIRTAIYYNMLISDEDIASEVSREIREAKEQGRRNANRSTRYILKKIEKKADKYLKTLYVSDFMPEKKEDIKIGVFDIHREGMGGDNESSSLELSLFMLEDSKLYGHIYLEKGIAKAISEFYIKAAERLSKHFNPLFEEQCEVIKEQYEKISEESQDAIILQIGRYGDYFTKSLGIWLIENCNKLGDNENLVSLRKAFGFGFKKEKSKSGFRKKKKLGRFPKTVSYIEDCDENIALQPGWVILVALGE